MGRRALSNRAASYTPGALCLADGASAAASKWLEAGAVVAAVDEERVEGAYESCDLAHNLATDLLAPRVHRCPRPLPRPAGATPTGSG